MVMTKKRFSVGKSNEKVTSRKEPKTKSVTKRKSLSAKKLAIPTGT